jgi:uncharacterized repeat protein (TIGR03803 family)
MTPGGGSGNVGSCEGGTIFKIDTAGTGYQILHNFNCSSNDATWSPGNLTRSGSILYGMTFGGGTSGRGTIFKINTDGTGFQQLHNFTGSSSDGADSHGSLILSGSILYGMTMNGGTGGKGIIFQMNTSGTGFQVLHSFNGGSSDGAQPIAGALVQSGAKLYGMTYSGGSSNYGTVFQIDANGSGFQLLHTFDGSNGKYPFGILMLSGQTLYGMTSQGGGNNLGVIFAIDVPVSCVTPPAGDLNGDCKVDFQDFAVMASAWLNCGLEPPGACNQ